MKIKVLSIVAALAFTGCESEMKIASADVPEAVMAAFNAKYPDAKNADWQSEKEDGRLVYEVDFNSDGKRKEAEFAADGSFIKEN